MNTIRAKFECNTIETDRWGNKTAKMTAVYGTEGENKDFTDATPSGSLEIHISGNAPASEFINPGDVFYLDFTKAE